jgi:hypothetical protein
MKNRNHLVDLDGSEVLSVHAMNVYWKSRGLAPLILNLDTPCRRVVYLTPGRFNTGKESRYALTTRLGGAQSWSGHFEGEKNFLSLPD